MGFIDYEVREQIGIVTFNRPAALNALNTATLCELDALLSEIEKQTDVRVVIFTGEGKAFIAGADIKEMSKLTAEEGRQFGLLGQGVFLRIEQLEKVTIAAVNGFALGGGCELAMACDLRIASPKAKFGQPEVSLGITPGFSATQRLPKIVGISKAKELIYTGRIIGAEEALNISLVNSIAEDDLLESALEMAEQIASQAPLAVLYSKKAMDAGLTQTIYEGNVIESNFFGLCFSTEDQKEGMSAFIHKKNIAFKGR